MAESEQRLVDDEHPYVLEDADDAGGANDGGEDGEGIIPWAQPVANCGPADVGMGDLGTGMSTTYLMADDPGTLAAMSAEQ